MAYSWDERKRIATRNERNLDFADAIRFFDGRSAIHQPTPRHGEDRWKSTAFIERNFYTVVWMWRGRTRHIISMRRSHAQEIGKHRELHGE
jgi:uncharacterized DUF497 family protein